MIRASWRGRRTELRGAQDLDSSGLDVDVYEDVNTEAVVTAIGLRTVDWTHCMWVHTWVQEKPGEHWGKYICGCATRVGIEVQATPQSRKNLGLPLRDLLAATPTSP